MLGIDWSRHESRGRWNSPGSFVTPAPGSPLKGKGTRLSVPVLVRHDAGCRYARPAVGGHSDAAKRMSDHYNLHKTCGAITGHWLAFALADGAHDGTVYESKLEAVVHQHHGEWWCAFIRIGPSAMSVCEAESQLVWQRQQAKLKLPDRDDSRGGLDVIRRLTVEDQARQTAALRAGSGLIALGYRK
jgi:hypothetical protein